MNYNDLWKRLESLFKDCKKGSFQKLAQSVVFDFQYRINDDSINKEASSAKTLENVLAVLTDGTPTDSTHKTSLDISKLLDSTDLGKIKWLAHFDEISSLVSSNNREKGDISIDGVTDHYLFSIKSLTSDNAEINFGSFEFSSLLYDIDDELALIGERTKTLEKVVCGKTIKIGRGSQAQLKALFDYLISESKFDDFIERLDILLKGVFKDDILIYIKNNDIIEFYLLAASKLIEYIIDSTKQYKTNKTKKLLINRWEGNAIRISRDVLLDYINKDTCMKKYKESFVNLIPSSSANNIINAIKTGQTNLLSELKK